MELKGKLIEKLKPVTGTSQKGEWTKQDVIIETAETYPKKICISFWKENVIKIQATPIGSELVIDVNIESREYNGRWFTEIKAWKFTANGQVFNVETPNESTINDNEDSKKLPF